MTSVALFAIGCGGNEQKPAPGTSQSEEAPKHEAVADEPTGSTNEDKQEVILHLEGNDQMQYDKLELKVPANSTVTLTLAHTGKMAKEAMGHNFVLLKPGTDIPAFATKAIEAGIDKDYIPESDAIITHTKLLGGGEETTITFDAPAKGTYDYICSFPGHYGTMHGKLIVE
ncbi:MAG: azurin [Flavobacteriales bacterium]|nr:azurin [Flavobacteriales bacterium]